MKKLILILSIVGIVVIGGLCIAGSVISTLNTEVDLRTSIHAKQKDNKSELDNMVKKINQTGQVTKEQVRFITDLVVGNSEARATKGGSLATFVREAVPTVDTSTFNNLMNIITSSRDSWTMRQKELLDLSREHNRLLNRFPSGMICSVFGRQAIEVTIVTSSRTEESFKTGKDDNTDVFNK